MTRGVPCISKGAGSLYCVLLLLASINHCDASLQNDLKCIARELTCALNLSSHQAISFTTLSKDRNYNFTLEPLYKELKECMSQHVSQVTFTPFTSSFNPILKEMILTGSTAYHPIPFPKKEIAPFVLYGMVYLNKGCYDTLYYSFAVIDRNGTKLFDSNEYALSVNESPQSFRQDIFNRLQDPMGYKRISYRGRLIGKLDKLFNSAHNNLLTYPAEYTIVQENPYAVQWQVNLFKHLLSEKYGIVENPTSENAIQLLPRGVVAFKRNDRTRYIDNAIDGEPLLPISFLESYDSLYYLYATMNRNLLKSRVEAKSWNTKKEIRIRDQIFDLFNREYPKLFNPFDYQKLQTVYQNKKEPSILTGSLQIADPTTGKERVHYEWCFKASWLASLHRVAQNNRHFDVDTYVMGVFKDNLAPRRYWAIVAQKWKTKNTRGTVIYSDDGYLIVNIDFDKTFKLSHFSIHYRLWFYNYQFDEIETSRTRYDKLLDDVNQHFVYEFSGVDHHLKEAMRDFLIQKIEIIGRDRVTHKGEVRKGALPEEIAIKRR